MSKIIKIYRILLFGFLIFSCIPIALSQTLVDSNYRVIKRIAILGNNKTHSDIVFRELTFGVGDTILQKDLEDLLSMSRQNLMNTSLFNFVSLTQDNQEFINLEITIELVERWYIWPSPILNYADRNFNEFLKFKDWDRINYGLRVNHNNFRGQKELLTTLFKWGYDRFLGLNYYIPYINKNKTLGLFMELSWQWNHETSLKVEDDINVFYKAVNGFAVISAIGRVGVNIRPDIYNTHAANIKFESLKVNDSILLENPNFLPVNQLSFISFEYKYKSDHRDFSPYPLKGYYWDIEFTKHGFNALKGNPGIDYFIAKSTSRKYLQLKKRSGIYGAIGFIGQYTNKPPGLYYYYTGLGYSRDFIRAYEYNLIESKAYAIIKSNLKWNFLPTQKIKLKKVSTNPFHPIPIAMYLNLFLDYGATKSIVKDVKNSLQDKQLIGYGIGMDIVSYYDKVFRLEYSLNSIGENGIFIHFIAPI